MKIRIVVMILLINSMSLWAQTDKEKATTHYETAIAAFKSDYTTQEEFYAGMDKADSEVNKSLTLDQTNPEVFYLRGKLFAMQKRWEKVIEVLDYAIGLDNTNWEYYMKRGMTRTIVKERTAALIDLNKAIELAPEQGESYFHRGMLHYGVARDTEACQDFNKAVELGYEQAQGAVSNYCGG